MEASQELALLSEEDFEVAKSAIIDGTPIPNIGTGDPMAVSKSIAERIAAADTFEEAFSPQDLDAWTNYLGIPVLVQDFHLNPTGFLVEGNPSVYAVCDIAKLEDGEIVTVTCGGRNVLMQLLKMKQRGWSDRPVVLVNKRTAEGYNVLWLESAVQVD
jgi:hypothetical protein